MRNEIAEEKFVRIATKKWDVGEVVDLTPDWNSRRLYEMNLTQVHSIENSESNDQPSFSMVFEHPSIPYGVFGQVSLKQLDEALKELGYSIQTL